MDEYPAVINRQTSFLLSRQIFANVRFIVCEKNYERWGETIIGKVCNEIYFRHVRKIIPKFIAKLKLFIPSCSQIILNRDVKQLIKDYVIMLFEKECLDVGMHYK